MNRSLMVEMMSVLLAIQALARADELSGSVARYEAWRGGQAFMQVAAIHAEGRLVTSGLTGVVETWASGGSRFRQDVDLGVFNQHTVVANNSGWSTNMSGQVEKLSPADLGEALHDGLLLLAEVFSGRNSAELSVQPAENRGDTPCDIVRVSFGPARTDDYLIAHADGELIAIRSRVKGKLRVTTYADWRTINGVRFPFRETVTGEVPSDESTTDYRTIEVNPSLSADIFAMPRAAKHISFADAGASSGWLAFELFDRTRLFIPARINGHPTTVLLDSGATSTVLDSQFATSNGLKVEGEMTAEGTGGTSTAGVVRGVNLELGTLSLHDVTAVAIDAAPIERQLGHTAKIFLGAEIFQDTAVDIDFPHRRIAFRDPATLKIPSGSRVIPSVMEDGQQILTASLEGRPARLLLDLGNAGALALFPRFWEQQDFLGQRRTSTALGGGFGGMHTEKIAMLRNLSIGGVDLPRVPVKLVGNESADARSSRLDGNIGMPVFSRFHLIVDRPHERLLLVPPLNVDTRFDTDRTGLTLQPTAAGFKIIYVAPGAPGDKAGLKVGDEVVSVEGAGKNAEWRFGPAGRKLLLRLSDGRRRELTLADYF